jgi:hypothetical protein
MRSKPLMLVLPALLAGALTSVFADPIPIDGPVVITKSGSYVVTQDFTAVPGYAIRILGSVTVDIDFAGHTVGSTSTVLMLRHPNDSPQSPVVTVHDGTVVGGYGAYAWTNHGHGYNRLTISRMTFEHAPVWIEDGGLTVTSSRLDHSQMMADANFGGAIALFENNDVIGADLVAYGPLGGAIRDNRIDGGSIIVTGSDGFGPYNTRIENNVLYTGSIKIGQFGVDGSSGLVVRHNDVAGTIDAKLASAITIANNHIAGCGAGGAAITIKDFSRFGAIEGNILSGACPFGILFDEITRANIYQDNDLRSVTCVPVQDDGLANVDGGGNRVSGVWTGIDPPID